MELLFLTLNARRIEDQQAIEQAMASRDKGWLVGLGLKGPRTPYLSHSTKCDENEAEQVDPDSEMAALEEEMVGMAINTRMENERPNPLTMRLIRDNVALSKNTKRRARSPEAKDTKIDAMLRKKVLRVDWLEIGKIENLDAFTHVEELYLQYNLIETIEGLDNHAHLTFLALAGNRIREVKNLKNLSNLKFLDLSMNYIDKFDVSEFLQSLHVLRVAGNPFVESTPARVANNSLERFAESGESIQTGRTTDSASSHCHKLKEPQVQLSLTLQVGAHYGADAPSQQRRKTLS
ncbi:unnamed protein product [Peronospora destructor]|uniref:Uncharacterized protein n=1 Tax=Peronospora destructor TaxID=86335 RepID=A0AAV0T3S6_9STRA|nr:unnamed protein product [Peronospora destructor]